MSLANLIEQVRSQIRDTKEPYVFAREVPATETSPAVPDELETFVMRAVHDYSRWRPLKGKPGMLTLIPEKVDYELPTDFIQMETFPQAHRIFGKNLYLASAPSMPGVITYYYDALHTPETIPVFDEPAIVWLASSMALRAIVGDPKMLQDYISYDLEDVVRVNTENLSEAIGQILKAADQLEKQYNARIATPKEETYPSAFMTFG
ncbi:hypothetical protein SAMN04489735_10459 [Aneurinibacillus thermoaerophilus]|uniref:Uncharacterized protein n=1 Tax=Aneurinibacillus thermoaerophilus TaxID=143495 RepID=A0A1G8EK32_ANETH|nr:hypothetical protein [Aneurinibacillus thermoaerophilus]SDH70274.1 hypothetical protein SAMN04489735_10459 [Aneurinibacillus thermoaerophilus]